MVGLDELGGASCGVWSRRDALTVVSKDVITRLLADGIWQRPWPGVLADGGFCLSDLQVAVATNLASGGSLGGSLPAEQPASARTAVTCGRSAARVLGVPLIDDDDPATGAHDAQHHDVAVWNRTRALVRDDGQVLHRHRLALARTDVGRHVSGLWITTHVRTLWDLTSLVSHEALVCAIDHCLHRGTVTEEALRAYAATHRHHASYEAFVRALDLSDGRAESPAETLARLLLLPVLPDLVPQVRVFVRDRLVAVLDLADEDLLLAVEVDGKRGHAGEEMAAKDRRRDTTTADQGWWTERVTWYELRCRQEDVVRRVMQAAARLRRQRPGVR